MKNISFVSVLFLFSFMSSLVHAQEQGDIRAGIGVALGSKAAVDDGGDSKLGFGINIGGEYLVTDIISVAPSYTFFFESESTFSAGFSTIESTVRFSSFNIDGRYYFDFATGDIQLYGMLGLSFAAVKGTTRTTIDDPFFPDTSLTVSADDNEVGLNIGAGAYLPLGDSFLGNGQVKYNTPLEQFVLQLGVAYVFRLPNS